ncbi:MAG: acetylglutamate kinase [Firmicutes bacterium]|nr:acetylglutamate kinase [Bacillota bacterium]
MDDLIGKAQVLTEALPYIRSFAGSYFVIKYGGQAMVNEDLKRSVAQDIVLLKYIGINPVVVHGGGKEVTNVSSRMGIETVFAGGLRVTDEEAMEVVEMVLAGKINQQLVGLINSQGGKAVGLSGKDGHLFVSRKKSPIKVWEGGQEKTVDLGLVGEIEQLNPQVVLDLSARGYIPVISSLGVDAQGRNLNMNADHVAGELAGALQAEKLLLLTDVEGIFEKKDGKESLISVLSGKKARELIKKEIIKGGMIPKVESCLQALAKGVKKTHIIDGRIKHCMLLEIFTDKGIGTMVVS